MEEACAKVVQTPSIAHAVGRQAEQARLMPARAEETLQLLERYGGTPWRLGGFRFPDGSVLKWQGSWAALAAPEAARGLWDKAGERLEVRLPHAYWGRDGRLRRSLCEAVFEPCPEAERWRLRAEYEPFMDSPLFGLQADRFEDLLEVGLVGLGVRAAQPGQGWRLEQVALHPDWVELLELGALEP